MKRSLLGLTILLLAPLTSHAQDAKKEIAKLQGTWTVKELHYDGKEIDNDKAKFKFVFKKDQVTVAGNDELQKEYARFTVKLDPSVKPAIMDIKITAGSQKDVAMEGIYAVKGDELKICLKVIGNERPSEFAAPAGANVAYVILTKEK